MKKAYIIMTLLLTGIVAEAQTSVWDGSRKLWTSGSGTEADPYLIESAENLAFLSYMVNKNFDTQGLYFRLITDIDLNGSEDQPWKPIGLYDMGFDEDGCDRGNLNGTGYSPRTMFRGHFDGGGHVISNIYVDNEGGYAGLFGYADSWTDKDVVIENLWVGNGYIRGNTCGGIIGKGSKCEVSHCRNGADIEGTFTVGGILGNCGKTVSNCSNAGRITGMEVGGIVGGTSYAVVTECFNEGDIMASRIAGGILCCASRATLDNCYNTGDVSASGDSAAYYPMAGGLVGTVMYNGNGTTVSNSYNVGEVTGNHHVGCLFGYGSSAGMVFENCYYLDDCYESELGTPKSAEEMLDEAFVNVLDQGNGVWGFDVNHVNDGFPILIRTDLSVNSHAEKRMTVYPNPTNGVVNIEGVEVARVQVYNILGQVVRTFNNSNRINVGDLPEGVYLLRVTDKEGKTCMEKIVKE